jgi:hypothetical protein
LAERELEAMGSVYTFGGGDVGQLGLGGSRLIETSLPVVIPQLRAVGVRTLRAALDTDVFMAITASKEVVVWGNARGVPMFGLKPQEMVDLELLTPRAGPEFDMAIKRNERKKKKRKKKKEKKNDDDDDDDDAPPPDVDSESRMSTGDLLAKKRSQQKATALRGIATNTTVGPYGTHEARRLGFRSRAAEPILIDKFHDENIVDVVRNVSLSDIIYTIFDTSIFNIVYFSFSRSGGRMLPQCLRTVICTCGDSTDTTSVVCRTRRIEEATR